MAQVCCCGPEPQRLLLSSSIISVEDVWWLIVLFTHCTYLQMNAKWKKVWWGLSEPFKNQIPLDEEWQHNHTAVTITHTYFYDLRHPGLQTEWVGGTRWSEHEAVWGEKYMLRWFQDSLSCHCVREACYNLGACIWTLQLTPQFNPPKNPLMQDVC